MTSFINKCKTSLVSYFVISEKHIPHNKYDLFRLLQKGQGELDSGVQVGTIIMDLSKAYMTANHMIY